MKRIISWLLITILFSSVPVLADGYTDMIDKEAHYTSIGDYAKAIASYQLAQRVQPENDTGYLGEANIHFQLGDYAKAMNTISTALEKNPLSAESWLLKCLIDVHMGDIASFESDVLFAEVCGANLDSLYLPAAVMYASVGYHEKAVDLFSYVIVNELNNEQRSLYRRSLLMTGQKDKAIALGLSAVSIRNKNLDNVFTSGMATLAKANLPVIDIYDFEFSDALWEAYGGEKTANPYETMKNELADAKYTWLSFSPTANSGILMADTDISICYYEGKYRIMYPSKTRGVADEYSNLDGYASLGCSRLLGKEGVVYSPDGRYAAINNTQYVLMNMRFFFDPIIIDLATGEMILTATYQNKIFKDGAGAVTTSCFSADGRFYYYFLYGTTNEHKTSLYRCDLTTMETEFCISISDYNYYPHLAETENGSLIILRDTIDKADYAGITLISYENEAWKSKEIDFKLLSRYWRSNKLMYSQNSDNIILSSANHAFGSTSFAFQHAQLDESFFELDQYAAITKADNQLKILKAEEIANLVEETSAIADDANNVDWWLNCPYQLILSSHLSPDGHYLLLLTDELIGSNEATTRNKHLFLVRLEDLTLVEVLGVDPNTILSSATDIAFPPIIEWNSDILLVGTTSGVQAFSIQ